MIPYEFDELAANNVLDEIHGLVVWILNLPEDEHLEMGVSRVARQERARTIWDIS